MNQQLKIKNIQILFATDVYLLRITSPFTHAIFFEMLAIIFLHEIDNS